MALNPVQSKSGGGSSAPQLIFTSTPTQGNLLVAALFTSATLTITMTSSGWTALSNNGSAGSGGSARSIRMFYKIAGASESTTVTFSTAGQSQQYSAWIAEYPNIDNVTPLNIDNNAVGASSQTQSTPTVTPTGSAEGLVICAGGIRVASTWSTEKVNSSTTNVTEREDAESGSLTSICLYDLDVASLSGTYAGSALSAGSASVGASAIAIFNVSASSVTTTKTETGIARITATTTKTETGVANIFIPLAPNHVVTVVKQTLNRSYIY